MLSPSNQRRKKKKKMEKSLVITTALLIFLTLLFIFLLGVNFDKSINGFFFPYILCTYKIYKRSNINSYIIN